MAKSQYEYVRQFEQEDSLLKNCWLVCRIDGRGFHQYANLPGLSDSFGTFVFHAHFQVYRDSQLCEAKRHSWLGFDELLRKTSTLNTVFIVHYELRCEVMADLGDIVLAFGESDEFSFVFRRDTALFGRRARFGRNTTLVTLIGQQNHEHCCLNLHRQLRFLLVAFFPFDATALPADG